MALHRLSQVSSTPPSPPSGYCLLYFKTDNVLYIQGSDGIEHAIGTVSDITDLHGDGVAHGPGDALLTVTGIQGKPVSSTAPTDAQFLLWNGTNYVPVNISGDATMSDTGSLLIASVGGSTAANIHSAEQTANSGLVSYPGSGLSVNYTAMIVEFNGVVSFVPAGSLTLGSSLINNFVYVDTTATVTSGATLPPNAIPLAMFSTNLSTVTFLEDARVILNKNQVWGALSDIQNLSATASASAGTSEKAARADHVHAIPTAAPVTQTPNQSNAAGSSASLARADHVHDIPTAAPISQTPDNSNSDGSATTFSKSDHVHDIPTGVASGLDSTSTNTQGSAAAFARQDHTHHVASGTPVTQSTDQANAAGTSPNFAKADHVHNIPTDVPVQANADGTDLQGSSTKFARADHKHDIAVATPVTQNTDQANAAGSSSGLARADHVHNIPTDVPIQANADGTDLQGSSTKFARADHKHDIAVAVPVTQTPDQSNSAGSSSSLARADHVHDIPTAAPVADLTPNTTNAQGSASTFARSDHSHAVDSAAPVTQTPDQSNSAGSSAAFAKSDHVHNIPSATPVQVGTSNNRGSAASFALSDHVHAVTFGVIGGLIMSTYVIGSNAVIAATDSIVQAFGKLQAQISAVVASAITGLTGDVTASGPGNVPATIAVGAVTDTKASLANKPAVSVVATTNQTLSGTPTIDGQATTAGTSIVLLTAQSAASQNGPWVVQSGAWTRPTWYPSGGTTQAFQFITTLVRLGTVYQGSVWRMTTSGAVTIDTTATTWVVTSEAGNYRADYTIGTQSGSSSVTLAFANAFKAILGWNPTANFTLTMPPTAPTAGQYLGAADNSGTLQWTNPVVNIDGGTANSVYTPSQVINGGTP